MTWLYWMHFGIAFLVLATAVAFAWWSASEDV
jgi:predicted ribosomally synthesized peptide with SipW-like signal peptide